MSSVKNKMLDMHATILSWNSLKNSVENMVKTALPLASPLRHIRASEQRTPWRAASTYGTTVVQRALEIGNV